MATEFSVIKLRNGHGPALIFVNGFLNGTENDFTEWLEPTVSRFPHNPCYGVRWESGTLLELGAFMTTFGAKTGMALAEIVTAQAVRVVARPAAGVGLAACLWNLMGNPWHKAYRSARVAGKELAQWLQLADEDEFILMGHSLGAKVVFHTLETLADAPDPGCCVRDVYMVGGAVSNAPSGWKKIPYLLTGSLYNVFSRNDDVLRLLYSIAQACTSSPIGYAGLELPGCPVLANVDATPWVEGHSGYKEGLRVALGGLPEGARPRAQPQTYNEIQEHGMAEEKAPDTSGYEKNFNEEGFWGKVKKFAKTVGCEGIRNALRLYYSLDNPDMPMKIKALIYAALGYFISPIDVVPDITPFIGFSDDIAGLALAVATASVFITAEAKAKADEKLEQWFGAGAC